jgi:AcrR family transcriptional regulator
MASATAKREYRSRDPEAARDALIAAGARIFNRDGYFATNSNAIAREAGYAPASFYTYFDDKRALFLAVYERWVRDEWEEIRGVPAGKSRKDTLNAIVDRVLSRHRRTRVFRASLRALDILEPSVRQARNAQRTQQLVWMEELARTAGGKAPLKRRVVALFTMERLLDAMADSDTEQLGVAERDIRRELTVLLERLLFGGV